MTVGQMGQNFKWRTHRHT